MFNEILFLHIILLFQAVPILVNPDPKDKEKTKIINEHAAETEKRNTKINAKQTRRWMEEESLQKYTHLLWNGKNKPLVKRKHSKQILSYPPSSQSPYLSPPSHSLTQTDREYYNIVRTEDGQSGFVRGQDRGQDGIK